MTTKSKTKSIKDLPMDIQRSIAKNMDSVIQSQLGTNFVNIVDSVNTVLAEWNDIGLIIDPPKTKDGITKFFGYSKQKIDSAFVHYGKILINVQTNQIVHVSTDEFGDWYNYTMSWNSPQHVATAKSEFFEKYHIDDQPGFNVDLYEHRSIRGQTGFTDKTFMKSWLYAFIIMCHKKYPEHLTPEIYTHILTRFRQKQLLQAYPPLRSSPAKSKSPTSNTAQRTAFLEHYQNMEGVKGYKEAVKTFLKRSKRTSKK